MKPLQFCTAVRRRLRWALALAGGACRGQACNAQCHIRGDHRASCSRSGLLKRRAKPLEKTWARVLREAGARVKERFMLRDAGIQGISNNDRRQIEVMASGLSYARGVPVAVDCALVSPLGCDRRSHSGADKKAGVA